MTFPIDLHEFFDQGRADVIMHRELVQTSDIDGEKFVAGSLGMPKRIIIYDESDITRQGTSESGYHFKGRKQIVEFSMATRHSQKMDEDGKIFRSAGRSAKPFGDGQILRNRGELE